VSAFGYGASFVDRVTGLRWEAHHPASRPDRWSSYLEGAAREYDRYGIAALVDRQALERGDGVSIFFVAVDPKDRVVAGLRCHGPLDESVASQALAEMAASPEWRHHHEVVAAVTPYGVVEMKGAWRETSGDGRHAVSAALARCCVHAVEWLGAEVMLAAVADRMEPLLASVGSLMMGSESAPYPSEKYRTILTRLRRARYRDVIDPDQAQLLRQEAEELHRTSREAVATGWRPVVLDTRHRPDRHVLANLRADPSISMLDVVDRQRAELRRLLPSADPVVLDEVPRHVYYPWRRAVVRMLGPDAFCVVRLDRNRNRITRAEQERLRRQRVGIVGLSSGHAVATTIALEGLCGELRLADFDDMELTNLNRIPASVLDVGVNKAVVAARRVAEIDPYLPVRIATDGLTAENADEFVAGLDVVVEQCDELDMKLLVREVARRQGVAVVMETSDRGLLDVERFDIEPERPPFHGLLGDMTAEAMRSLSVAEKIPYVLTIVETDKASARGVASMAEIGRTLSTWPQLGSEVTLGGASVAAAVRRIGVGEEVPSGRTRLDMDAAVAALDDPPTGASNGDGTESHAAAVPEAAAVPDAVRTAVPPDDPMLALAHAAGLAPSCGNGQPWQFTLGDGQLEVGLVRSRGCGVMDVRARASYVGIGAAVFNARVAAAHAGLGTGLHLFPHGATSDVVAELAIGSSTGAGAEVRVPDEELAALYEPMLDRCSNRRHGVPEALDLGVVARLNRAAALEGATLHLVTDPSRLTRCAELMGATERVRFLTPGLREATMREMRFAGDDVRTGIDLATLELSSFETASIQLMRRADVMELLERWDAGHALGDYLKTAVLSSSALAVISMVNSTPASYVTGGMALERVWIEAQRAGLAVHAVGPAFLYAVQDSDFETLCGTRWADDLRRLSAAFRAEVGLGPSTAMALVLRLSHAPPPSTRSLRLPIEAVTRHLGEAPA
jgi:molybdopterin/thiamine biosynthesis adenylyltransferase